MENLAGLLKGLRAYGERVVDSTLSCTFRVYRLLALTQEDVALAHTYAGHTGRA